MASSMLPGLFLSPQFSPISFNKIMLLNVSRILTCSNSHLPFVICNTIVAYSDQNNMYLQKIMCVFSYSGFESGVDYGYVADDMGKLKTQDVGEGGVNIRCVLLSYVNFCISMTKV